MKKLFYLLLAAVALTACSEKKESGITAEEIINNPDYQAISYGGYRGLSRDIVPTVEELKEDMRLLEAMGIKIIRTYDTGLGQTPNLLEAIKQLKEERPGFEMYIMMGAWIDAQNARTDSVNHLAGDDVTNAHEIDLAVKYANQYPDIVKIIAVGNEAMVHWQEGYWVTPTVILKWVNYLQDLKKKGGLPADVWITSSDNFASWGGGDWEYKSPSLDSLIAAVDFISMHTYPYHDTHYNNAFWKEAEGDTDDAMNYALNHAMEQYYAVKDYVASKGFSKPVVIGETGWASMDDGICGPQGSGASDEYKQAYYHRLMRQWTDENNISCFYFEAFDEPWKDANNAAGSENHFGMIDIDGHVKYPLWELYDLGVFNGLHRGGKPITKSFDGDMSKLLETVVAPK